MRAIDRIIVAWGVLEIAAIGWHVIRKAIDGRVPFISDIISAKSVSASFGSPFPLIITIISILFYFSLLFSGYCFINRRKAGALLSYIQCPFRLLTLIPISIFFLPWPVKYIFGLPDRSQGLSIFQPSIIVFLSIVLFSEILKTITVFKWHRILKRSV